jgi:hypothetical protein
VRVLVSVHVFVLPAQIFFSYLQLVLTERGATKVHGKISFIDLAGSERGADTYSSPNLTSLSFYAHTFDFQLPQRQKNTVGGSRDKQIATGAQRVNSTAKH